MELANDSDEKALAMEMSRSIRNYEPDETKFGAPRAANGIFALNLNFI